MTYTCGVSVDIIRQLQLISEVVAVSNPSLDRYPHQHCAAIGSNTANPRNKTKRTQPTISQNFRPSQVRNGVLSPKKRKCRYITIATPKTPQVSNKIYQPVCLDPPQWGLPPSEPRSSRKATNHLPYRTKDIPAPSTRTASNVAFAYTTTEMQPRPSKGCTGVSHHIRGKGFRARRRSWSPGHVQLPACLRLLL